MHFKHIWHNSHRLQGTRQWKRLNTQRAIFLTIREIVSTIRSIRLCVHNRKVSMSISLKLMLVVHLMIDETIPNSSINIEIKLCSDHLIQYWPSKNSILRHLHSMKRRMPYCYRYFEVKHQHFGLINKYLDELLWRNSLWNWGWIEFIVAFACSSNWIRVPVSAQSTVSLVSPINPCLPFYPVFLQPFFYYFERCLTNNYASIWWLACWCEGDRIHYSRLKYSSINKFYLFWKKGTITVNCLGWLLFYG